MEKLGYVSSCLGLRTTAALLDIPYGLISREFFNEDIYTSTHQHRLHLVSTLLTKNQCTATSPNPSSWFNTPSVLLQGRTPLEFISSLKPGREAHIVRALIGALPKANASTLDLAA